MDMLKLKELLEEMILDCDVEKEEDFIKDGYLTSLTMTQLVVNITDEFDVEISPVEIVPENFKNIKTIADMIDRLED